MTREPMTPSTIEDIVLFDYEDSEEFLMFAVDQCNAMAETISDGGIRVGNSPDDGWMVGFVASDFSRGVAFRRFADDATAYTWMGRLNDKLMATNHK
jgi:hypothetical protein